MINPNNAFRTQNSSQIADRVYKTKIKGLYYIDTTVYRDDRGFFVEIGNIPLIEDQAAQNFSVKQLNQSCSKTKVVRGFHAEDWNKLITVASGIALCVLADVRPNSETFLQTESFLMSKQEGDYLSGNLFIPAGLGNSLCVIEGPVNYIYAVDKLYSQRDPKGDQAISLFDPDLNVNWPFAKEEMIISERDQLSKNLRELYPENFS